MATAGVNESTLTGVGSDFTKHEQAGFQSNGRMVSGTFEVLQSIDPSTTTQTYVSFTDDVYTVKDVTEDAWNWGLIAEGGGLSVSMDSKLVQQYADTTAQKSGFMIDSGPVAEQTFAGGGSATGAMMYVGGSDYSQVYVPGTAATVDLTPDSTGKFSLDSVGFGSVTFDGSTGAPTQAYFNQLGYPN
jgi:hypothetical protein